MELSKNDKKDIFIDLDDDIETYYHEDDIFHPLRSPKVLEKELQSEVDKIIEECPDVDWDEDYLSKRVIASVRDILSRYIIPGFEKGQVFSKFDFEAYKLTGIPEKTHGDIAFIINKRIEDEYYISGVGFYEAKAAGIWRDGFPAFDIQQLRRLVTNTPKLTYLLYNKFAQACCLQEWSNFEQKDYREYSYDKEENKEKAHVYTIDANLLKGVRSIGYVTRMAAQGFGYHFVNKILSGRDLDYTRPPIETIRRWLKNTRRSQALIVFVTIQDDSQQILEPKLKLPGIEKLQLPPSSYSASRRPQLKLPGTDKLQLPSAPDDVRAKPENKS